MLTPSSFECLLANTHFKADGLITCDKAGYLLLSSQITVRGANFSTTVIFQFNWIFTADVNEPRYSSSDLHSFRVRRFVRTARDIKSRHSMLSGSISDLMTLSETLRHEIRSAINNGTRRWRDALSGFSSRGTHLTPMSHR